MHTCRFSGSTKIIASLKGNHIQVRIALVVVSPRYHGFALLLLVSDNFELTQFPDLDEWLKHKSQESQLLGNFVYQIPEIPDCTSTH